MNLPSIRQISFFLAVSEVKNFSEAANLCNVSQQALSKAIQELEDILGHKLFNRQKRKVTLTALGAEFLPTARHIMSQTESLVKRAREVENPMSGPLRLGIIPTIAPYMLPIILPTIQMTYPNLELQIFEDQSARLAEQLENGALDLILLAFPFKTPKAKQKFLFEEPFYLAIPKSYDIDAQHINAADLEPGKLLLLADGHCLTDHALQACNLQKLSQRKTYSASSLTTLIQMVSHGYGMTLLPEMAIDKRHIPENIKIIPFKNPKPTRRIGLAWLKSSLRETDFLKLAEIIEKT